jgi:hypothetical protein
MVAATMSIITTKPSFLAITKNLLKDLPDTLPEFNISHREDANLYCWQSKNDEALVQKYKQFSNATHI